MSIINADEIVKSQSFDAQAVDESSEYQKMAFREGKQITEIPIWLIEKNKLDERSLTGIDVLAESIRSTGNLLSPIVVYRKNGHYVILSGHRRYTAWKKLVDDPSCNWSHSIPATVVNAPGTITEERLIMAQANMHRWSPEQRKEEINICLDIWDNLTPEKQSKFTSQFKDEFITKYNEIPSFKANPSKFLRDHFRPKWEFVRMATGITSSDKTLMKLSASPADTDTTADGQNNPTIKHVKTIKRLQTTIRFIEKLALEDTSKSLVNDCIRNLEALIKTLKELSKDAV